MNTRVPYAYSEISMAAKAYCYLCHHNYYIDLARGYKQSVEVGKKDATHEDIYG